MNRYILASMVILPLPMFMLYAKAFLQKDKEEVEQKNQENE